MKHGKKPNREQRKIIEKHGYNSSDVLVIKDTPYEMQLVFKSRDNSVITLNKNNSEVKCNVRTKG